MVQFKCEGFFFFLPTKKHPYRIVLIAPKGLLFVTQLLPQDLGDCVWILFNPPFETKYTAFYFLVSATSQAISKDLS